MASRSYENLHAAKSQASELFLVPSKGRVFMAYAAAAHPTLNVVGVGIARKVSSGKTSGQPCVRFYVARKLPKSALNASNMLPSHLDGVITDVIEAGVFKAFGPGIKKARSRLRPVKGGCSVGFAFPPPDDKYVMAGTMGALVEKDGEWYLLSNNHVLADENRLKIGSPIYQPGLLDGGKIASDQVAKLAKFRRLKKSGNVIDAAIAKFNTKKLVSAGFVQGVKLKSTEIVDATEHMQVHKMGRTTGYTHGVIDDISADVKVGYETGDYTFKDQIIVRGIGGKSFSDSGDSGSLIVERASGKATALLFAGSDSYTIANHIAPVLKAFGVKLVK